MRTSLLIVLLIQFCTLSIRAQRVHVLSDFINPEFIDFASLNDFYCSNGLPSAQSVQFMVSLTSLDGSNIQIESMSNAIWVPPGVSNMKSMGLGFQTIRIIPESMSGSLLLSSKLPAGTYDFCVQVISVGGNVENLGDRYCRTLFVISNEIITNNIPFHESQHHEYPQLWFWNTSNPNWSIDGEYHLVVYEISDDQDCDNFDRPLEPLVVVPAVQANQVRMSDYARYFKTGQKYSWNVRKIVGEGVVNESEETCFTLLDSVTINSDIILLDWRSSGSRHTVNSTGIFAFSFKVSYDIENVDYKIENLRGDSPETTNSLAEFLQAERVNSSSVVAALRNQFKIDFKDLQLPDGLYKLTLRDGKGFQTFVIIEV